MINVRDDLSMIETPFFIGSSKKALSESKPDLKLKSLKMIHVQNQIDRIFDVARSLKVLVLFIL